MGGSGLFLLAHLALAVMGAGVAFHPSVRAMPALARIGAAFGAGAVVLALEATVFSVLGIPWSIAGLGFPPVLISLLCIVLWRKQPSAPRPPARLRRGVAVGSAVICGMSFVYLFLSFTSSSATSLDFLFFWGVKAAWFADARGLSAEFLRGFFNVHAALDYPPLVPVTQAWGCLWAGRMPWRIVPACSALWAVAAVPLLFERLRRCLGDEGAAGVVALWTAALSVSMVKSYSGGNAEIPLLYFESVALVWLLTETSARESRLIPTLALCGAALTKVEGMAAVVLIAAGSFLSDAADSPLRRVGRSLALVFWPAALLSSWFLYQASRSLPVGFRGHGQFWTLFSFHLGRVLEEFLRNIDSGSFWLPWVFALAALLSVRVSNWRAAAPALVLAAGLMGFLVFDYLHDRKDPTERIGWTTPRVVQPALSAMILAAGVVTFGSRLGEREIETP